ncbi:MAG: DUF6273 domain-containing protein [Clostridiales bacterium]|jgi:hypothetical protein|nr:DUF6273 domain-containing protein [Clostridiales bacterium]
MICPLCKKEDTRNMEMCPNCGAPIKPLPVPPGGKMQFGKYSWYVLDKQDDRVLIITEKVIERRPYHSQECDITWETSDMRRYLNGDFYHSFDAADRGRIIEVTNENPDNPWYGTSGGNSTTDKIFLLSIAEVVKYFGDSGQINTRTRNPGCDWCKDEFFPWFNDQYDINRRAVDQDGIVRFWTLRTPGATRRLITLVMGFCGDEFDHGGIDMAGGGDLIDGHFVFGKSNFMAADLASESVKGFYQSGVRPALWLRTGN